MTRRNAKRMGIEHKHHSQLTSCLLRETDFSSVCSLMLMLYLFVLIFLKQEICDVGILTLLLLAAVFSYFSSALGLTLFKFAFIIFPLARFVPDPISNYEARRNGLEVRSSRAIHRGFEFKIHESHDGQLHPPATSIDHFQQRQNAAACSSLNDFKWCFPE